jgi:hypothetical protein
LCLSSSSAFHFFWLFFSCPPPCQPVWLTSPCTCNGLWTVRYVLLFFGGGGQQPLVPLLLLSPPLFPIILFLSPTLSTGMTGISLHNQWPLNHEVLLWGRSRFYWSHLAMKFKQKIFMCKFTCGSDLMWLLRAIKYIFSIHNCQIIFFKVVSEWILHPKILQKFVLKLFS